jgi:tetratricopeptide (TPR) repeat protein
MKKKLMSTLSLLFALSLLFSVAVSANTPGQENGQGNGGNQETVEQEETEETTTDEETEEIDDETTEEDEEAVEGEEQEGKGKPDEPGKSAGKGLQKALENMKGLPSEKIIEALLDGDMDVSEVAQGLQELADEEGETDVSDEELKEVTDELRNYLEAEELDAEQELEIMSQMVDVYEKVGSLDDAIDVQEDTLKKNYKDLEAYKKLGKLKEKKGDNGNAEGKGIVAFVNGEQTESDVAPMAKDGRTFLPFRAISQSLKADVSWNEEEKSVTVTRDGIEVKLVIGSSTAYVNGEEVTLDAPPEIIEGRTVVPVRFVVEAFGAIVKWEAESKTVVIYEEETTIETTTESTTTE